MTICVLESAHIVSMVTPYPPYFIASQFWMKQAACRTVEFWVLTHQCLQSWRKWMAHKQLRTQQGHTAQIATSWHYWYIDNAALHGLSLTSVLGLSDILIIFMLKMHDHVWICNAPPPFHRANQAAVLTPEVESAKSMCIARQNNKPFKVWCSRMCRHGGVRWVSCY